MCRGFALLVRSGDLLLLICRREVDVQRRLERIECIVTQYSNVGEQVMPVIEVARRTLPVIPRVLTLFQDPFSFSGIIMFLPMYTVLL